jgi:hypothetical protein
VKNLEDTKPRRGLSCCYNRPMQDGNSLGLGFRILSEEALERYILQNNEKYVLESFFQIFSMASKYIFSVSFTI